MIQRLSRQDRLYTLAKACQEKGVNPDYGNYAGLVRGVCAARLFLSQKAAIELTRDLTLAYRYDKWAGILGTEATLKPEPETPTYTLRTFNIQTPTENPLKNLQLTEPLKPVKTIPPKRLDPEAEQKLAAYTQTTSSLSEKQTAALLYNRADKDRFNGVGRIVLPEIQAETGNKNLTLTEVLQLWQKYYPRIEAEPRANVILIYFDNRADLAAKRKQYHTIQPLNEWHSRDNLEGDVTEDCDGEDAPEVVDEEVTA